MKLNCRFCLLHNQIDPHGGGYAGEEISMNNTSDSAGINMDADAIFALYQLEGERELGRINVKVLKNRLRTDMLKQHFQWL